MSKGWIRGAVAMMAAVAGVAGAQALTGPIQKGETVYIEVYGVPEMTSTVRVDVNGKVKLPYVNAIPVSGLSESAAASAVAGQLESILRNPRVTVSRAGSPRISMQRGRTDQMTMEIFPLQNANWATLAAVLRGMSSSGGAIAHDPDTNTLVITDTPSALRNILDVVNRMDQMQSLLTQVRIETRIAEVRQGALKELGIRWFAQGKTLGGGFFGPPTQTTALNQIGAGLSPQASENISTGGGNNTGGGSSTGREFVGGNVFDRRLNIPVQVPLPGQTFLGFSSGGIDVGAMLDALVTEDKAEVIASPMILTVNHKTARIKMIDEFPVLEFSTDLTGSTRQSVTFMELGIILDVTPHVHRDANGVYVKMELRPEVSFASGSVNGVPIRSVRSSETIASVRSGQTLVVGGILKEEERKVESKLPGIGNLPIIGFFFRHKETVDLKTELMIFVTPTVHERPEEITWDKMLDISKNPSHADLIAAWDGKGGGD